jgi:anti-sigma factor RsiW
MSMENFKELPLEVRLSAYIDGQVGEEDKRDIEAQLATDPHARELLDLLKAGSEFGNEAFAEMLKEPVPLDLVRSIKAASTPASSGGAVRQAANSNVVSFFRFMPQAIAASVVLLLAGGYSGYFIGMKNAANMPSEISETSGFEAPAGAPAKTREIKLSFDTPIQAALPAIAVTSVANIHDVYSKETTRLAEIPASDANTLKTWLASSTGVSFNIPDLSAEGLNFQGGRLVAVDGNPAGALYYKDANNEVVAVYFIKGTVAKGQTAEGANQYLTGTKGDTAWFVAGPNGDAALKEIAGKASAAL